MGADPAQVVRILRIRGVEVWLDQEGRLMGRHHSGKIPDDMRRCIVRFKPLIIEELKREASLPAQPTQEDDVA